MTESPPARIFADPAEACRTLAAELVELVTAINASDRPAVLGLATGRTPLPFYAELIRLHRAGELSFAQVITFNLAYLYAKQGKKKQGLEYYRNAIERGAAPDLKLEKQLGN